MEVLLLTNCPGEPLPTEAVSILVLTSGNKLKTHAPQFRAAAFPNSSK